MDKKDFYDNLYQFYFKNQSRVIGAVIGFIIGILILSIGFFKTLLLVITTGLGYVIGSRWNIEEDMKTLIDKIIPERFK
ncbi:MULTISPECIES: DUF2273 domain-containing protein [unclassified Halanaerobium]|uniref:DUF2273 domain-containing protein n=1 Tax=unclassified Halanaerobium TaxID=2641197 RepID=UPI000DF1F684|nr:MULTISPECIES: DUF2273 domain-containing protein [unclassified Halanaerobium]RCW50540.1 putative membrane protein [Halanaerobium sp. MA284_MarDTE_T2]RCW86023.1 putative membrane protein [Halanaerobium sp. DL-01]